MPPAVAQTTRGRPRRAVPVAEAGFPEPPASVSIRAAVESLRARLTYVHDVLGLRIELVALLANLSHKALRNYRLETWNPSLVHPAPGRTHPRQASARLDQGQARCLEGSCLTSPPSRNG